MKLLLDESVPRRLANAFPVSFTVRTVQQMGWAGTANGRLLGLAVSEQFSALVTVDQGIAYQQNVDDLPIPVIIMLAFRNRLWELESLVSSVVSILSGELQRRIYVVST